MKSDHIVIRRTEPDSGYYTVESEGKMANYLTWGEMLEQVISLTHSEIKDRRYAAKTTPEQEAEDDRRAAQFRTRSDKDFAEVEPPPLAVTTITQCTKDERCVHADGHESDCSMMPF